MATALIENRHHQPPTVAPNFLSPHAKAWYVLVSAIPETNYT